MKELRYSIKVLSIIHFRILYPSYVLSTSQNTRTDNEQSSLRGSEVFATGKLVENQLNFYTVPNKLQQRL